MGVRFAAAIAVALLWVAQAHSQGEGFEWWFDGPKITDTRDPDAACLKILIGAQGGYGYGEHQISHEGRRSNGSPKVRCLGDSFHPSHRPRGELFDFGLMYNRCKPVGGGATVPNENCGPDSPYQRQSTFMDGSSQLANLTSRPWTKPDVNSKSPLPWEHRTA